jgi:hypothetical protein
MFFCWEAVLLYFRRTRFLRRVILPFTLLAFLSACRHWVDTGPATAWPEPLPSPTRITLKDHRRIVLERPTTRSDSIIGMHKVGTERGFAVLDTLGVSLDDVWKLEHREYDGAATGGLIGGIGLVFAVAISLATCADFDSC